MSRQSFSIVTIAGALLFTISCNNSVGTSENATDTLSTDSTGVAGKDHTAVAKDSGTAAVAMPVDTADKAFIIKAASGGLLEVDLGGIAGENGKSPRVKQFGEMLIKDHTDANSNLRNIAKQLQVAIPDSMMAQDASHKMDLQRKKGSAFDNAYLKMMIEDHKKDIADFEKAAKSSNNLVKNFAAQTLPVLNKHLDSANVIARTIK